VGRASKPEPMKQIQPPDGPWVNVAMDLLDVPGGTHLLVLIDVYSRWPEVIYLNKITAKDVIAGLSAVFQLHGLPEFIRSDNGPPFSSMELENYLSENNITHQKGIPYWPQSNGDVERMNETLLKIIRIAHIGKRDWKVELNNFLFQYRVTTQTTTGLTPSERLMGRKLRDKLHKIRDSSRTPSSKRTC